MEGRRFEEPLRAIYGIKFKKYCTVLYSNINTEYCDRVDYTIIVTYSTLYYVKNLKFVFIKKSIIINIYLTYFVKVS